MKCKLLYNFVIPVVIILSVVLNCFSFEKHDKSLRKYFDQESQSVFDTVKKNKRSTRANRISAVISVPSVSAGSSCGDGVNFVQVNLSAFASNTSETVEWFTSQNASTPIFTGNNFSPSIRATRTYYVRSRLGSDFSTRVPVAASVFVVPPAVTLSSSPVVDQSMPFCLGQSVTFTANGGADLFEFSVDGNVVQQMSSSRTFITNTLTDGQVVMVRSRFSSVIDGVSNERAFGTGPLEDNGLSSPLSSSSVNAYVNAVKIASEESNIIFAVPGKVTSNNSLLLFLDTKPGGFSTTNFADVVDGSGSVKAFNFINDNSNAFDSYFEADYCLVFFSDPITGNYSANLVELKSDTSLLSFIGNASSGNPSSAFGVNPSSSGISDISNGFEILLKKAAIGYTTGDVKLFAFTVVTDNNGLQSITNSFLSPERSSSLDYGSNAVDYNLRDPNPVIVASAALTPCYAEAFLEMSFVTKPIAFNVVQPTCTSPTGTLTFATQDNVQYSLDGINFQNSPTFGNLNGGTYNLYTKSTLNGNCITQADSAVTVNNAPTPPAVPTAATVVQPTCAVPTGSITVSTQNGVEYSLNGTNYQASNVFSGLAPNTYTLYVRSTTDNTCITSSTQTVTINNAPTPPELPTAASVVQPTCAVPSGSITVSTQNGVEYSLNGTNYQVSNVFSGLAPNTYTLYVRSTTDNTCITSSTQTVTINNAPIPPAVPTAASVVQPTCAVPTGSITVSMQYGVEYSLNGINYQASNVFSGLAPNTYTLYIRSTTDNTCITSSTQTVTINNAPTPPTVPTASSVVQPTCAVPTGSITVSTQNGVQYSLNGTNYQASNVFSGLAPNTYTLYVRSTTDNTCITSSTQTVTIDAIPQLPTNPTAASVVQPTCAVPTGSITISAQQNVQYSIGNGYQNSPVFANLVPGNYTMAVRFTNSPACIATGGIITINAIPQQIQFETESNCINNEFVLSAIPRSSSYDPAQVTYQWKDPNGVVVGTDSSLNLSKVTSNSNSIVFPAVFSLSIRSAATGCETTQTFTIESIFCNIQKGISPDGNGSNDSFDLTFMKVKKLEVFNRYGIKVYSQSNYTDQWKGQSNSGEDLPSATYYYVIEFESGTPKTGWIYLIREK
ncbi:gliding motility-associated C-terminal domain-containing protein [Flavobacterium sp. K77]|uniref:T9SS type B sorting domain-containing protein n=1 Tax=Flavobacterium sp. K77 TaxID=2910676 RepID=UPI001F3779A6|nr:gliding motility-associated C-terminal domain-containing protein [Flavobacterium sp. K77]MCF6142228.1 gliding motility-associated C-terminal domain-containing protein [Flavobacterium sp. K77]